MIVIDNVEISKNPVNANEAFLIKVSASEVIASWNDTKSNKWSDFIIKTWDQIKRKIF